MGMRIRAAALVAVVAAGAMLLAGCADEGGPSGEPAPTPTREAPTLDALLTAEVPALCEHPAGALKDGVLPGVPEQDGRVTLHPGLLDDIEAGDDESDFAVVGEDFVAAAVYCDRGGVAWPDHVVVWDADMEQVGMFEPETVTGGDRESIAGVVPAQEGFTARWIAANDLDAACCQQLSAEATVTVDDAELEVGDPTIHRGEDQVRAVAEAAVKGEKADGVDVAPGLYENLAVAIDKTKDFDPDGVNCVDGQGMNGATITCGIPAKLQGGTVAFVIYPVLDRWNDYKLAAFEQELF